MSDLSKTLKRKSKKKPIGWKGPTEEGISQSMIQNYLSCRERFRIRIILGLSEPDSFRHQLEYGNMWHLCEEHREGDWKTHLKDFCRNLCDKYPTQQREINKWYNVCIIQFEVYLGFVKDSRRYIFTEQKIAVKYTLPSGREILLRGMIDGGFKRTGKVWIQENKCRGQVDEYATTAQLGMDMQTLIYRIGYDLAIQQGQLPKIKEKVHGVYYNVIRRPLSGGKGSIRPHKAKKTKTKFTPEESMESFYERLRKDYLEKEPEYFFLQWEVPISSGEIKEFKERFLNPILENILDDFEWWSWCFHKGHDPFGYNERSKVFPHHLSRHYVFPYGIYNPTEKGRSSIYDEYMRSGSTTGLEYNSQMFPELQ